MTFRAFHTGRDFFGTLLFDQESEKQVFTPEDFSATFKKCMDGFTSGHSFAFRVEQGHELILIEAVGPGVFRMTHSKNGNIDPATLGDKKAVKARLTGFYKSFQDATEKAA